jgi:hypothetical protein
MKMLGCKLIVDLIFSTSIYSLKYCSQNAVYGSVERVYLKYFYPLYSKPLFCTW